MTLKAKLLYALLIIIVWPLSWILFNKIGLLNPINWDLNVGMIFGFLICLFFGPKMREKLED
jgi:hypothetical protein